MTREEILSGIARLQPWFHCIDLGNGIKTKTESTSGEPADHPWGTWHTIQRCLPDLSGKNVLDVGCNAGFYAVEAKRRGAAHVMGIDAQRRCIQQALFVRRVLGLEMTYRKMSVYDLTPRTVGQFDVTLALGLIYHCKHLVQALENLWYVTKELLVIETAIYPADVAPPPFEHAMIGAGRSIHALAYVENPPDAKEAVYNWFLPSIGSLQALLQNMGVEVSVFAASVDRAVLVCRKSQQNVDSYGLAGLTATLTLQEGVTTCSPGAALQFRIRAENTGYATWRARGFEGTQRGMVCLGAHLLREEEELVWDYGHVALPYDVSPGEAITLDIMLPAPQSPGQYMVEFDMVDEHLSWFEDLGSPLLRQTLFVADSTTANLSTVRCSEMPR